MLIVCPTCATSYAVTAAALGAGRTVRCARCRTQWFATLPRDAGVSAFVDDVIAEAGPRAAPPVRAAQAAPPPPAPPVSMPAAEPLPEMPPAPAATPAAPPQTAEDVARFTAALDEVSAVEPMRTDDVSGPETLPPAAIADAPPIVPPDNPPTAADLEDIEHFAARRAQRQAAQQKRKRATLGPALAILLALLTGALVVWRNDLVRHVPQTASLFQAIGLPVNVRGLTFEDVAVSKETHDGVTVLVVEGKIVSTGGRPAEVPRLRFAVRNTTGNEIYSWTAQPPRSVLGAGESVAFRSRLAAPPAGSHDVLVRFFTAHDISTGTK